MSRATTHLDLSRPEGGGQRETGRSLTEVVDGDAVAPPELSGHAPVVDILEPAMPDLLEPIGDESKLFGPRHLESFLGHALDAGDASRGERGERRRVSDIHLYKPLLREEWFDDLTTPLAAGDPLEVLLGLQAQAALLGRDEEAMGRWRDRHVTPQLLATLEPVKARILPTLREGSG
jgi:hypothetical protein